MKLLLAEDNTRLSKAVKTILSRNGYRVEVAFDGEEAIDLLHSNEYDGVILDVMMPKKTGIEILTQIRSEGNNIPALIVTAKSDKEDIIEGLDAGANDYVTKPFDIDELLARIKAMLRGIEQGAATPVFSIDDVRFNRQTLEMTSRYGTLRLDPRELTMAEMLVRSGGNPVSVARLSEKVFDGKADFDKVFLYISYLNKKLDTLHSTAKINGSRDVGYWIEESDNNISKLVSESCNE